MQKSGISASAFADEYEKVCERVGKSLREYLSDPNEENTRLVRAALRRQSTMAGLVSKRARPKAMKLARDRGRKVLKATSRVRDLDIIRGKLSSLSGDPTVSLLLSNMAEERGEYTSDAMKPAWKLFELGGQKLPGKEFRGVSNRMKKSLVDLASRMEEELELVVKNEGKVEELHALRKHVKRFRYGLELLPEARGSARAVALLKSWQDLLGEIRDCDAVIAYLGRARQVKVVREMVQQERVFRHRRYRTFVRSHAREFMGSSSPLKLASLR